MIKKLSKNVVVYGGVNALKSLVPLLLLPILTHYLSTKAFGILSLAETSILFLTPFILLNINAAINVEYFKLEHRELKLYITNALLLSFIAFTLFLGAATIFHDSLAKLLNIDNVLLLWIVVFSFLRVISSVVLGFYQVREEVTAFASFSLFQTFVDFLLSYLFVVIYQHGYIGRLEGTYISFFLVSILGIYILLKRDYLGAISFKYTKEILNFGVPLIIHGLSGTLIAMSDRYFISYFIGNDAVGLYAIAYQLSALMLLFGVSINQAWSPMLFSLLKNQNFTQVKRYTFLFFGLFIFFGIAVYFAKDLLFYLFVDEKFFVAKEYFGYLLIGFIFQSLYFLVTNILFFEKRTKLLASMTMVCALMNLVLNYYFINIFGVIGVAYATAITWALFFLVVSLVNFKILKGKA